MQIDGVLKHFLQYCLLNVEGEEELLVGVAHSNLWSNGQTVDHANALCLKLW
jgi:hypothetical protein